MPKKIKSRGTPIEQQLAYMEHDLGKKIFFSECHLRGIFSLATQPRYEKRATRRKDLTRIQAMNQMGKESKLWEEIKEDLRRLGNVGEYGFESYISQLKLKSDTGTKLVLEYPVDMFIDWVETYYSNDIRMSAARVLDAARELEYVPACSNETEQVEDTTEISSATDTPTLSIPQPTSSPARDNRKRSSKKSSYCQAFYKRSQNS